MGDLYSYYSQLPILEWCAVVASLFYVVLAAYKNSWCWPAALVSTILYTYIFYDVYLWMDSLLQVYYIVMALYGWYCWSKVGDSSSGNICVWPWQKHAKISLYLSVIVLGLGYFMANYTPTDFPYLDSLTTVFAVFATYLITQKVLENWLYWLVIDALSVYIYIEKDLQPTAFLFVLYIGIAWFAYIKWLGDYREQNLNKPQVLVG